MYEERATREKILKKIRKALIHKSAVHTNVDFDTDIFKKPEDSLEVIFAQQLTKLNGKFIYCANEKELSDNLLSLIKEQKWNSVFAFEDPVKEILKKSNISYSDNEKNIAQVNVGISLCEYLSARTGSVFVTSKQNAGRRLPAFANYHIVIAYSNQLVYTIKEALNGIKQKYGKEFPSMIINISGPSRTADIEKTLVQGAHGPKEIYVLLVDK
ncbi:MAG TPA: LUD domain-containing protein [Bacteroidia bacterium]|nr:LUD domain-containing protein [Bacteroidia bacterium]